MNINLPSLLALIAEQHAEITALRAENEALRAEHVEREPLLDGRAPEP